MAIWRYWAAFVFVGLGFAAEPVRFNRDIRPIMSDTCFRCHGPDKRARMADLRLDIREEATKPTRSGSTPIVPGDPDKSAIVQRIFATNARIMPPKFAHKDLTDVQKQTIRRWVAEGAVYEGHWAYQPVARPPTPAGVDPIDYFIRARLDHEGLKPSPEADRRTLLRRVSLDLTGLPPTPAELKAFLDDSSPTAYEKAVDRLLASPRYAEKQAMHWLDAVRYADSAGFHGDNLWPAWPYRDYVLRAFRDNMPFDQFTREQIGGDLIPDGTVDQKVASAYNRLNRASAEGGLQAKEYLAKYAADRARTTSTVWLGSTLGCAECHDHKFDPFLSRDFYSMEAFFADVKETGLIPDRGKEAWGSKLLLPNDVQRARLAELDAQLDTAKSRVTAAFEANRERQREWEQRVVAQHKAGDLAWHYQRPVSAKAANGATLTVFNDEPVESNFYLRGSLATERGPGEGLIVASGANPDNETYTVQFKPGAGAWTELGLDVFQDESLPGNRLSRGADRFVLTNVEAETGGRKLAFQLATTTGVGEIPEFPPMAAIDGDTKTGWAVTFYEAYNPFLAMRFAEPVSTTADSIVTVRLRFDSDFRRATIGRFRLALSSGSYSWPENGDSNAKNKAKDTSQTLMTAVDHGLPANVLRALTTEEDKRTDVQKKAIAEHFQWASPEFNSAYAAMAKLAAERGRFEASIPRVIYTEHTDPRPIRILPRGNFLDESGDIVTPAIPRVFGELPVDGRATRLDLAGWLTSTKNPLTARVFVNRVWREFFGTGLSKVLEDVGSQGEWPTHPELLDWMAAEFMSPQWQAAGTHPWDVRHLIRTIVLSQTYRQSSLMTPQLAEHDPDNRLLARQSRFRVDAEIVHDIALAVSGSLVERFGGPSVRPPQPDGYMTAMNFPKREYSTGHGDELHRRAVYTQWQRTFLHPTLLAFDAPTREDCAVNRTNSNTPLQALDLLNDPIFVDAARAFARTAASERTAADARIAWAFERATGRPPDPEERRILGSLYQKNLARFKAGQDNPRAFLDGASSDPNLAALATVTRAILNLHETITRN